jgi:hypothetical protein
MERCALLALGAGEPQAGTAPVAMRWAALEHRGAWPRNVAEHHDPLIGAFVRRAGTAGYRTVMIRRPGRRHARSSPTRLFLADTVPPHAHTTAVEVVGPEALAAVPLPATGALPGRPVEDPLLLVCTHGRRDRCCALDGRALATALAAAGEADVWESSHLGGHRFAPTALVLPTGYLYGRLDLDAAIAARKAARLGEMEPDHCRGRSTWPPEGQVAELAVRAATGLRDAEALVVSGTRVRAKDGRAWDVDVEEAVLAERPPSCGAPPLPAHVLRARGVTPLRPPHVTTQLLDNDVTPP